LSSVAPVGGTDVDWPGHWKNSSEAAALIREIEGIERGGQNIPVEPASDVSQAAFAMPYIAQVRELVARTSRSQYRNGSYWASKTVLAAFYGLFVGFCECDQASGADADFFKLPATLVGVQSLSLAVLVALQVAPPLMIDIAFSFQAAFNLFVARERNGIYSWYSLITAIILVETPTTILAMIIVFFCTYWTAGFNQSADSGGILLFVVSGLQ
jgi:ATP-binding cassette subfamily G (WHITE) protein 2 (SNQ2)